jgi:hypothetical protein
MANRVPSPYRAPADRSEERTPWWRRLLGSEGCLLIGLTGFAVGVFVGPFLTQMAPIDPEAPLLWPLVRVVVMVGSPLLVGIHVWAASTLRTGATVFAMMAVLCLVICGNAVSDLVTGPLQVDGTVEAIEVSRGSKSIDARIEVRTRSGDTVAIEPWGAAANELETVVQRSGCTPGDPVRMVALERLDRLMSLRCERAAQPMP